MGQLIKNCFYLNEKKRDSETLLIVAVCLELQLSLDRAKSSLLPSYLLKAEHIQTYYNEGDSLGIYIASQLIKCAIHTRSQLDFNALFSVPS